MTLLFLLTRTPRQRECYAAAAKRKVVEQRLAELATLRDGIKPDFLARLEGKATQWVKTRAR